MLRPFTLHLDFLAADTDNARWSAAGYANALMHVCPEVDAYRARISVERDGSAAVPVFCQTLAPVGESVCTDIAEHGGWHHDSVDRWSDAEVPDAPGPTVVAPDLPIQPDGRRSR